MGIKYTFRYRFRFKKPADCLGENITQDDILCDTLTKAYQILETEYNLYSQDVELIFAEQIELYGKVYPVSSNPLNLSSKRRATNGGFNGSF